MRRAKSVRAARHQALKAPDELKATGTAIRVIELYCVMPLDGKALAAEVSETAGRLVTVEDHWPRVDGARRC